MSHSFHLVLIVGLHMLWTCRDKEVGKGKWRKVYEHGKEANNMKNNEDGRAGPCV